MFVGMFGLNLYAFNLKTPESNLTRKGSIIWGQTPLPATVTRKLVNLTRNMTQRWFNQTPLFVKSAQI